MGDGKDQGCSIDKKILKRLARLVEQQIFPNRSKETQNAIGDKLNRLDRTRLAKECARMDAGEEQALTENGSF